MGDTFWRCRWHCSPSISCPLAASFQVWRSCEWQPGGGNTGLAIPLGHRHRILLLHLWGWAAEPHGGPAPAAGHLPGWHSALPAGQWGMECGKNSPSITPVSHTTAQRAHPVSQGLLGPFCSALLIRRMGVLYLGFGPWSVLSLWAELSALRRETNGPPSAE